MATSDSNTLIQDATTDTLSMCVDAISFLEGSIFEDPALCIKETHVLSGIFLVLGSVRGALRHEIEKAGANHGS